MAAARQNWQRRTRSSIGVRTASATRSAQSGPVSGPVPGRADPPRVGQNPGLISQACQKTYCLLRLAAVRRAGWGGVGQDRTSAEQVVGGARAGSRREPGRAKISHPASRAVQAVVSGPGSAPAPSVPARSTGPATTLRGAGDGWLGGGSKRQGDVSRRSRRSAARRAACSWRSGTSGALPANGEVGR
jgi:hypothetical protein